MNFLRHIIRGCGNLPECGEHPGTSVLLIFLLLGFITGLQRGSFLGGLAGLGISALFYVPLYLYGAYNRSVCDEKLSMRKEK